MDARLMTTALSNLKPFPKQKAAETSKRAHICNINKTIVEIDIVNPRTTKKMFEVKE